MAHDQVNLGLLIIRVAVGLTMIAHGYNHFFRGGKIAGTARWFGSLGMKPGILHAWLASTTELVAGSMLVLGLLTPLAAGACMGVMLVAWITNHMKNGFFIFRPGEGYEYVMTLTFCGLALSCLGGGEWSIDHAAGIFKPFPTWLEAGLCMAAGIAGAAALLIVFWRPERKPATTS